MEERGGGASWLIFPHKPDPNIQASSWHSRFTQTQWRARTQAERNTDTQTHTLMFTVSDCSVNKGEAPGLWFKRSQIKQEGLRYRTGSDGKWRKWICVRMKQTLNKGSYESKTDETGPLSEGLGYCRRRTKRETGAEQHLGEVSSYPCLQCAVLIIPLFPWGFWRTHSDILVNI